MILWKYVHDMWSWWSYSCAFVVDLRCAYKCAHVCQVVWNETSRQKLGHAHPQLSVKVLVRVAHWMYKIEIYTSPIVLRGQAFPFILRWGNHRTRPGHACHMCTVHIKFPIWCMWLWMVNIAFQLTACQIHIRVKFVCIVAVYFCQFAFFHGLPTKSGWWW